MVGKDTLPLLGPDPNAPRDVHLVGRYALGVDWQDNHHSIYPFEFLRESCGCPRCAAVPARVAAPAGAPPAWPTAITREGTGLRIHWQDGHETTFGGRELRRICRCAACVGGH